MKTRYKDKHGKPIYTGDIVYVEEYPDKYVGGSLAYEALIVNDNGTIQAVYQDLGESEATPLSYFPVKGREIFTERQRYEYWRTVHLGGEPPEYLWREELYRSAFDNDYADEYDRELERRVEHFLNEERKDENNDRY